jgi:hypothetical protein
MLEGLTMTHSLSPDQLTLLSEPRVRHDNLPTSRDAAAAVSPHAGALENIILEEFCLHDGMTDEELCAWMPHHYPPTVKTCRSRLSKRGLLIKAGVRENRENSRGRLMTIWRLAS